MGGMGVVYRAYDERLDRCVAVKLLHAASSREPASRERLRREARAIASLRHPAIVQIYDLLDLPDGEAIVMEYVEGKSLAVLLLDGPFEVARGLALGREIAEALAEAHSHGIIHRDLKAENVLVTPARHAKILDFGIAKQLDRADLSLTLEGNIVGTCRAMSPEQVENRPVDARSDVFSLGTLLYETFTGLSPFRARSPGATLLQVCQHRQKPAHDVNPAVPEALSDLLDRMLQKDAAVRPQTALEVAHALDAIASSLPTASTTAPRLSTQRSVSLPVDGSRAPTVSWGQTAERRLVTVLRCSLVGRGGRPLDPEETLDGIAGLRALMAGVVDRFEGRLEAVGDLGGLAYFGVPEAHEDDAHRAVTAALAIAAGAQRLGAGSGREAPSVRIGIHTGPMVVAGPGGAPTNPDQLAFSETPSMAGLIQSLAAPGTVVVSGATHRLVEGFFDCEELPPLAIPGSPAPLRAFRVLAESRPRSRVDVAHSLTPLVGRERELGLLLDRWTLAREGRGQVVLCTGEAGLGKSRLVWELKQRIATDAPVHLEGFGSPFHRDSPLHPVVQWLQQMLGADRGDGAEAQLVRLEELLDRYGLPPAETAPVLAALLSLPAPDRQAAAPASPELQRSKTLATLVAFLLAVAERSLLLLVAEDLHWFDPSTLELLRQLVDALPAAPILLVLTSRPEFQPPPWGERSFVTRLALSPLSQSQADQMVERLTAGQLLDPIARTQIAARTDGVPLFVEELTKMVLESEGVAGVPPYLGEIPPTLEGWFRARLDRLDAAREVAQLAAVLGREFPAELLYAVAPWRADVLEPELERLVAAEIFYPRGLPMQRRYLFKHALLQDAAYASLPRVTRQRYHRRVAEVLQERFPEVAERQPELVAHHFTEAGATAEAVTFWQRAGDNAIRGWAISEALGHLRRALALLEDLPETPERLQQEIPLLVSLGVAEGHRQIYTTPEVEKLYTRAWELCGRVGPTPQLFPVLRGVHVYFLLHGNARRACEVARQMLELAEGERDPSQLLVAHQSVGLARLLLGELTGAREHHEAAVANFVDGRAGLDRALPGAGDPAVECLSGLALLLWLLGYPETALERSRESYALAQERAFPVALFFSDLFSGHLHVGRGEPEEVRRIGDRLAQLAADTGYALAAVTGEFFQGWAAVTEGRVEEGFAGLRRGAETHVAIGLLANAPLFLCFLAEASIGAGMTEPAAATLAQAAEIAEPGSQRFMDAEVARLRGELLLRQEAPAEEAEAELRRALDIARCQTARSLELRAALGLARLWACQDRRAEAQTLLAGVYGGFTEGFETKDLREARALLAELG
jgi:class 3 adenylate cyclase/predicted ATPase